MKSSIDAGLPLLPQHVRLRPLPLWAAFLLASTLFIGAGVMNYHAVQILVSNQALQARQRSVAIELQNLLRLALMAETGQRGFVITGAADYLEPYEAARSQLPGAITSLRGHLADDPEQMRRLNQVATLQQLKLEELAHSIAERREHGFEAAQRIVLTNQGKAAMDQLRQLVKTMDELEQQKLRVRMAQSAASAEQAYRSVIVAGLLDASLLLMLFILVRADARRRMHAAQRLADSRALLRNVIDSLPVLIWLKDRAGKIRMVNKAVRTLFGEAPRPSPDDVKRETRVMTEGIGQSFEEELSTPLGQRHFLSSRVPLRDHLGAVIGVCAVAADVTALKQAQAALYQLNRTLEHRVESRTRELAELNARLEDANAHLQAYDFSVAHDLRAPLRAIGGFAQAIAEDHADVLRQSGHDYLQRIMRAVERMEKLIDDLLAYSRLSDADLAPESVDLDALIREVREDFREPLAQAQASLEIAPALGTVQANRLACAQVLHNLLSNAIKFSRSGERQHIRIWSEPAPETSGRLRLTMEDHGIGLSSADAQRIFRPFERLHGMHAYPGSGIGLAIVARAIARMHGRCGAEPAPEGGARFWIELPCANEHEQGDAHRYSAD
jgi:signal transduction histidine kinase/CHASE3 domain sensor protein